MERSQIKVKNEEQIKTITPILALQGYTVRVVAVKKANSTAKQKVIEYWEEENR